MAVEWNGEAVIAAVRQGAMRGVVRGTEAVKTEADSLQNETPRTGRTYTRRGVTHVASSPGNPPAPDTGGLRQSLQTLYDSTALVGTVNAAKEYAAALEFGTARIAPRPFMRPALANKIGEIEADIAAEIRNAIRGQQVAAARGRWATDVLRTSQIMGAQHRWASEVLSW